MENTISIQITDNSKVNLAKFFRIELTSANPMSSTFMPLIGRDHVTRVTIDEDDCKF